MTFECKSLPTLRDRAPPAPPFARSPVGGRERAGVTEVFSRHPSSVSFAAREVLHLVDFPAHVTVALTRWLKGQGRGGLCLVQDARHGSLNGRGIVVEVAVVHGSGGGRGVVRNGVGRDDQFGRPAG